MAPLTSVEKAWINLALVSAVNEARWTWWEPSRPMQCVCAALIALALYALAMNLRHRLREQRRALDRSPKKREP